MRKIISIALLLLAPTILFAQEPFKFVVINDFSISKDSEEAFKDLNEVITHINTQSDIEFVLVLGNLTEFGNKETLEKVKQALDKLSMKYHAVSGNNETSWSASGGNAFKQVFGSERIDFEHNGYRFIGFASGSLTRSVDGHIDVDDIFWLNETLSQNTSKPTIIATHLPLTMQDVDNWYEATDIFRYYHVKLVLSAHNSRNSKTAYDGIPAFINKSIRKNSYDGLTSYNIYSVEGNAISVAEQKIAPYLRPMPWGSNPLLIKYDSRDSRRLRRPDYRMNSEYPKVDNVWTRNIFQAIYSSPATNGNQLFFGDDNGYLYCFEANRDNMLWKQKTDARILGTPAVTNNVVVVGSTDKTIYGLNAHDGSIKWQQVTGEAVTGSATIEGGTVYMGGGDNVFRALDINTGNIKWEFHELENFVECRPCIYKDKVIFGAWDGYLYALNKDDGSLVWKWENSKENKKNSPAGASPVAANDRVFITTPDNYLTALNVNTGDTIWQTNGSMVREAIGISEDGLRVYAKTAQDSVVCYSALSDVPQQVWAVDVGFGSDRGASILTEKVGTVFGSTENGVIFAIQAKKGELLWKHKVSNTYIGSVVPIDAHRCYYVTADGTVGLLNGRKN